MLRSFAVAFGLICATTLASAAPVEPVNPQGGSVKPCVVKLERIGSDPTIMVNGKPIPGIMMCIFPIKQEDAFIKLHREVGNAGMHLYADWFGTENAGDVGHIAPDRYDYSVYDKYFANILAADPDAFFLPHIGITAPAWWQKEHPEELCEFSDGRKGPSSLFSLLWRQEMGDDLRKLIAYLRQSPYADRIIGYTLFCGFTGEWQTWGLWDTDRDDYSPPATRAFREFLTKRYGADAALQKSWNDPQVMLATAVVPTEAQRSPTGHGALRDPETEQRCIDWYEFSSNMVADVLLYFAKVTREATNGESLVGTYYGYLSAHGYRQTDSGHCATEKVFDSPYIDFLQAPPNYGFRKAGETRTFMSPMDSLRMHLGRYARRVLSGTCRGADQTRGRQLLRHGGWLVLGPRSPAESWESQ
ncbi:MAG: beta-galactosidase [Lentisphaerae bacterium]|nr:beta-galactosidase [Lentisphaerota bacterium]